MGLSGQPRLPGEIKVTDRPFLKKAKAVFLLKNYTQGYPMICTCMCICVSMNTHEHVRTHTHTYTLKFREMQRRFLELRVFPFYSVDVRKLSTFGGSRELRAMSVISRKSVW